MLYRMIIMLALLPMGSHASQNPSTIQLPLDVTSIIVSHICKGPSVHSLNRIKNLNTTNKEWHTTLNTPRIFRQIVLTIAEIADVYNEITIAKSMRNWPGFKTAEFQTWFKKREVERILENELFSASQNNQHTEIQRLVEEQKVNINAYDKSGTTALSIAASSYGRINALQEILKHNPDINLANKNGWTPLKKAANEGNIEAVTLLLSAGADSNISDNEGHTPLLNAAFYNHIKTMKALIAAKANINHQPYQNKNTALMWAANNNNMESVALLLAAGARKDLKNSEGKTAWDIAKGRRSLTEILLIDNQNLESILSSITASAGLENSVWYLCKQ